MSKVLAIAAVTAVVCVAAAPANSTATKGPTLRSLQAQITGLQKQVKTLKKQVATAQTLAAGSFVFSGCGWAVTADAIQNTWLTLDRPPASLGLWGGQIPVNDYGTCHAVQITRAEALNTPPDDSVFQALLDVFKSSMAAAVRRMEAEGLR